MYLLYINVWLSLVVTINETGIGLYQKTDQKKLFFFFFSLFFFFFFCSGPHYSDWDDLAASGARSMASAPMYHSDRLVGILTIASSEPHAFERSRVVWLLAMALAPFVAGLRLTAHAVRVESFIVRIMPSLLKQNYMRTTGKRNQREKEQAEKQ